MAVRLCSLFCSSLLLSALIFFFFPVEKIKQMLTDHYYALRSIELFRETTFLYVIENNLGFEHQWVTHHVNIAEKFENVAVLKEREGQIGFHTDHAVKLMRATQLQLAFETDRVAICADIVTVNPDPRRCAKVVTETLIKQAENLREYQRVTMTKTSTYVTAIFNAEGKRIIDRSDDAIQSFEVLCDASTRFLANKLEPRQYEYIHSVRERRTQVSTKRIRLTAF